MYILRELWRGNISPTERFIRKGSDYQKTAKLLSDELDKLRDALSPEAKKQMDSVNDLRTDLTMLAEEDVFIYGFRMGARMMMDIVGEYKGQFYSPSEPQ